VIARPFVGDERSGFQRTGNRRDFAIPPPEGTLLDHLAQAGREIVTVGKIGDIFAHRSTGREIKPAGNDACLTAAIDAMRGLKDGGFVFANLVDFDSEFGHRRDVPGYAAALTRGRAHARAAAGGPAVGAGLVQHHSIEQELHLDAGDAQTVVVRQRLGLPLTQRLAVEHGGRAIHPGEGKARIGQTGDGSHRQPRFAQGGGGFFERHFFARCRAA